MVAWILMQPLAKIAAFTRSYCAITSVSCVLGYAFCSFAQAQVAVDISSETAKRANDIKTLDDLAVNDTALLHSGSFCINDGMLYMPGWLQPADLATNNLASTGLILSVEVLPGKKLRGRFVDAAQAQKIAQGKTTESSNMTKDEYNAEVIKSIYSLFDGGFFGTNQCEDEQKQSPLRKMNLFAVESLNGHTKISDLLASVTQFSTTKSPTPQ
jgi:hypothetical protein